MSMKNSNTKGTPDILQYILNNANRCTLQELYTAQQVLEKEKDNVTQTISQIQSHIAKLRAQYGDAVSTTTSSKNASSKSSSKSRKRKRKRQPNDDDDDFDPMQIANDNLGDDEFEFSPTSAGAAGNASEPITPVSATVMTPPSAVTMDGGSLSASTTGTMGSAAIADQGAGAAATGSTLTSRGSKKNSRTKRAKSATTKKNSQKKKRKKGKLDDDEDVMLDVDSNILPKEDDDDEVGYGLQGKDISQPHHQFWRMIDEYFQPVHNDPEKLNLLKPVDIENDEDLNQIPELGQHYLQKWSEEKLQQDGAENAARANARTATFSDAIPSVDLDIASDFFDSNSITVRLLQSMIEEQDVLNVGRKSKKGRPKLTRNSRQQQQEHQSLYREQILHSGEVQRGISACTDDYSTSMMSQIDSRVTQELQALGLFHMPTESETEQIADEDDEVLAEIKKLQMELKEQITLSNKFRKKILDNVMARRDEEETLVRRRREDKRIIREFERRVFNPRVRVG